MLNSLIINGVGNFGNLTLHPPLGVTENQMTPIRHRNPTPLNSFSINTFSLSGVGVSQKKRINIPRAKPCRIRPKKNGIPGRSHFSQILPTLGLVAKGGHVIIVLIEDGIFGIPQGWHRHRI